MERLYRAYADPALRRWPKPEMLEHAMTVRGCIMALEKLSAPKETA